ncbi:hypothetical protein RI030_11960 [Aphanizomenon flos-aquae NRERC-008]|uniref:Uncharacterized protein n=1 Tax=Aphanizomenon flos-aquae FACHB-1249 TaxID=2692889 RepID=A0ABR8ISZ3_APHFL|nr:MULTISPECIES: hypothetical protein [Aphanizomenon]MDJ0504511.1 hypothetical protein [Nostocales cyanobacterium LE14-WE12]MBD2390946.1 hypothetical protein [Aphanizomenon flos-aquae FACHB-1171]MBD2557476.1 hypothetical protein [Aphanizomenon flos-aquae FACHB-1290]MBD2631933.1 hypothetical protein [Aphanizomenon sp. FACHB-1399]MBD2642797.1 hypothetical protein [Aphanizomenon sp. FACHB-1401]
MSNSGAIAPFNLPNSELLAAALRYRTPQPPQPPQKRLFIFIKLVHLTASAVKYP